jgi:uncharacterized membrane protein YkoI
MFPKGTHMTKHLLSLALLATVAGGFAAETAPAPAKGQETVALEKTPAAVKEAITKAAGGAAVKEVEKETKDGKTLYEAKITGADGKVKTVTVDEAGKAVADEKAPVAK